MKTVNSIVLAMCFALSAGSVFAQDSGMAKDTMSHDAMPQTSKMHDGMKKDAMGHDAMKKKMMPKSHMTNDGMSKDAKSGDEMKDGMSHNTMH